MQQIKEKETLKVSTALKIINRTYEFTFRKITIKEIAEKTEMSREQLSRLTTDSKFSTIYNVAAAIYDCILERSYQIAETYSIMYIINIMSEKDDFIIV